MTIREINQLDKESFQAAIGPVFEHSSWIAAATWERRPFASREALLNALAATVEAAGTEPLLQLIRAHPELGGRLARRGLLTKESGEEQRSAGLCDLDAGSLAELETLNACYTARFGFPFIVCAKRNSAETILSALRERLDNSREVETGRAWEEIKKIAALRLEALVVQTDASGRTVLSGGSN